MAITKDEIFRAANELTEAGHAPTYLAVRAKLGSGSFGTLQKYLRAWREERERSREAGSEEQSGGGPQEEIPERFQALATRLARETWGLAKGEIEGQVQALRTQAEEEILEAKRDAEAAGQTVDALQGTLEETRAELAQTKKEVSAAREEAARSEGERARLTLITDSQTEKLGALDEELALAREILVRKDAALEFTARELQSTQERVQELKRERDEAREELSNVRAEHEQLKERAASLTGELKEAQAEGKRLHEQLETAAKEKEALRENLEQEKDAHRGTRRDLEGQSADLQSQVKTMRELRAQDREALERARSEIQELSERVDGLNRELRETIADRATLTERLRLLQEGATKEETGRRGKP